MLFRKKCGIDLGSDTIKIADKKNKKVVCEKNMIAVRDKTYVIAVGQRAYEMYEKTPERSQTAGISALFWHGY